MSLHAGHRLGAYEILSPLGAGGMGEVYRARDTRLGRDVAIKVLPADRLTDEARRRRFVQEARAASALNHPNIVTIYEIESADAVDFIVMEYVPGKTLEALMRQRMRLAEILRVAMQLADALARAHAAGIVHRDLKPANVVVAPEGVVKVLDFGLAKLMATEEVSDESDTATQDSSAPFVSGPGTIAGTPGYMSPEQAAGGKIDARSDIFAFGSVLYEMATGRRAFAGASRAETLAAVLHAQPQPPSEVVAGLPRDLEKLILRCLRKEPEKRFQHMADVKVLLDEIQEDQVSAPSAAGLASSSPTARTPAHGGAGAGAAGWRVIPRRTAAALPDATLPLRHTPDRHLRSRKLAHVLAGWESDRLPMERRGDRRHERPLAQLGYLAQDDRLLGDPSADHRPGVRLLLELVARRSADRLRPALDPRWTLRRQALEDDPRRLAARRRRAQGQRLRDGDVVPRLVAGRTLAGGRVPGALLATPRPGRARSTWSRSTPARHAPSRLPRRPATTPAPRCPPTEPVSPTPPAIFGGCRRATSRSSVSDPTSYPAAEPRRLARLADGIGSVAWSRDGRSVLYSAVPNAYTLSRLWRVDAAGDRPPERLELAPQGAVTAATSLHQDRLAFTLERGSYANVFRFEPGRPPRLVLASPGGDTSPSFSPDGRRIVFMSARTGEGMELWLADASGANPVQLTHGPGAHQGTPRFSPDGRRVVFESLGEDGYFDVWMIDTAGGRPRRLTDGRFHNGRASWSRDGRYLYYREDRADGRDIMRIPEAGGAPERVTRNGGHFARATADGRWLYYTKTSPTSPLFRLELPDGPEQQVVGCVQAASLEPGPDGMYYAGCAQERPEVALYRFDSASQRAQLLGRLPAEHSTIAGLAVSPDGKTILVSSQLPNLADLMLIENFR